MEMRLPTDILEGEHRFIKKVVDRISKILEQSALEKALDVEKFEEMVDFMRSYANKCHHGKEEELLFPALIEKGVPTQGCPIGALKGEHIRGRSFVGLLVEGTELLKKSDPGGLEAVRKGLEGIATLYPNHIWKEDFLLFPMTVKVMNAEELSNLAEQFNHFDDQWGMEKIRSYELFAGDFFEKQ
jgi:hemerythrin-like domain-containing protein